MLLLVIHVLLLLPCSQAPVYGLKATAQHGMVAIFQAQNRKMQGSRLGKQDDRGLSYIHHAAINNQSHIISLLLVLSMDVNARRNNILSTGKLLYCYYLHNGKSLITKC